MLTYLLRIAMARIAMQTTTERMPTRSVEGLSSLGFTVSGCG
jgi:hypothetical protein